MKQVPQFEARIRGSVESAVTTVGLLGADSSSATSIMPVIQE